MKFLSRQFLARFHISALLWLVFLLFLLGLKIFILLDGGTGARDAVSDRMERTTAEIEASQHVFEDESDRTHKIFRSVRLREFVASGIWYGAAVGVCVVGVLLSTFRWWIRPISTNGPPLVFPSRKIVTWLCLIAVIGLIVRLPRMNHSLYNDEAFNFTRYIHGQFKWDDDAGERRFSKASWQQTAWGNHFGNNGKLYSICARISHDIWQTARKTIDGQVSEIALRIPSLIAGVMCIIGVGVVGCMCFSTSAGVIAAVLTALHPWHIRYSTEARSYGMVMLFSVIILLSLVLAVRDGRWRWWVIFLIAQVLCLWSYVGSLYFLAAANIAVMIWILICRREVFPRWLVANSVGAILFLQIAGPSLPQIAYASANMPTLQGWTSFDGVIEIVAYLISGMPVVNLSPENPNSPAWSNFGTAGQVIFAILLLLTWVGIGRTFVDKNARGIFLSATVIGALIIAIGISNATSSVVHHWYVIYALPGVILLMATAVEFLWSRGKNLKWSGAALMAGYVGGFGLPFIAYLKQGKEPLREVMEFMRGEVYPFETDKARHPIVAAFWSDIVYDPTLIHTLDLQNLKEVIQKAKDEKRPLFVEFGYRPLAKLHSSDLVAFVEESGEFEHLKTFHGLEETQFTHHVYRWVGE